MFNGWVGPLGNVSAGSFYAKSKVDGYFVKLAHVSCIWDTSSGLFFHKAFARPRPKTLNWKEKKIATRPKTGNL
jgi:hypothetical protein